MEEYRSNSNKSINGELTQKEEEKKVGPVISGSATSQKKTGLSKFAESMIATSASDLGSWILSDVIVPKVKDTISSIVTGGINMLLYGKNTPSSSGTTLSKVSYGSFYSSKNTELLRAGTNNPVFDYDNIVFDNRGDAEAVLTAMEEIIDRFGVVSVGDLYDLADVPAPSYTAHKYGWSSMRNAQVLRCRDGYVLKLPRATSIN